MKALPVLSAIVLLLALWAGETPALTVDEVIKLKQAGVADSTIELMIRRDMPIGVWRQDGWIVYSTERQLPKSPYAETYSSEYPEYPMTVYPQIDINDRHRRK